MKRIISYLSLTATIFISSHILADDYAEGVPKQIVKSDYGLLHLILILLEEPISLETNCSSNKGLIVHDANESSKAALSFALTALASGSKFKCYVSTGNDGCSAYTGSVESFPVCRSYPSIVK